MTKVEAKLLAAIFGGLILWLRVVVLQDLFGWFVVPLGFGALSWYHAAGLLTLKVFLFSGLPKRDDPPTDWRWVLTGSVLTTLFCWGLGWLFHVLEVL